MIAREHDALVSALPADPSGQKQTYQWPDKYGQGAPFAFRSRLNAWLLVIRPAHALFRWLHRFLRQCSSADTSP